jgi:DNA-binding NarL/FixJ family response regulator
MPNPTRVLLVDDSADIRDLYQRVLNKTEDLRCVGTLESAVGLEASVQETRAEIAVVDLVRAGRDPFEAIRSTALACPDCRIIAFTGYDDGATRDQVFQAGAWSLVSKHEQPGALVEEIRRVRAL